jgi:hypothetical protein
MNQTAHISLQNPNFQKAKDTKTAVLPKIFGGAALHRILPNRFRSVPIRLRFGKAVSREYSNNPQDQKHRKARFSSSACCSPLFY